MPEMAVSVAARKILSQLFREVQRHLDAAAHAADQDIENVHRLRISTRRSVAALDVFREFLPANRLQVVTQQLSQIRSAAGTARDLDVMILSQSNASTGSGKLVKQLKKDRKHAQAPIVSTYKQTFSKKSFQKSCKKLLQSLDRINATHQPSFKEWARLKLAIYVSRFFSQSPGDMSNLRQLHRFRIEAKKFRYILNVMGPALPPKATRKVGPKFRRLQDELGKINDHAVAIARIGALQERGIKIRKKIIKRERKRLGESIQEFAKWWTQDTADSVQQRFESLIRSMN